MHYTFRTSKAYWIKEGILPSVLVSAFMLGLVIFGDFKNNNLRFMLLGLWLLSEIIVVPRDVLPLFRNHLCIDEHALSGEVEKTEFNVLWSDVLSASYSKEMGQPYLNIATATEGMALPLKYFEAEKVWQLFQTHVNPEALQKDAYKRLPGYTEWVEESTKLVTELTKPLQVSLRWLTGIGWICILTCVFCAFMAWREGQSGAAFFLLLFSLLGAYLVVMDGTIEMDLHTITYSTRIGRYQIKWTEIIHIETDAQAGVLVFNGSDKRLAILGPEYWSGANKDKMGNLLLAQIEQRQIPNKKTPKALFRWSKNAKI